MRLYTEKSDMQHIWSVRESGLGASSLCAGRADRVARLGRLGGARPRSWVATCAICAICSPSMTITLRCMATSDMVVCIAGSTSISTSEQGIRTCNLFMEEATDLCVKYGGSLSGEHGDGQSHSEFLYKMFGEELVQAFREFKSIWDPAWKMNPGKVVDAYRMDENLRLGANYKPWEPADSLPMAGGRRTFFSCRSEMRRCREVPASERTKSGRQHDVPQLHGDARREAHDTRTRPSSPGDVERQRHREWLAR